MVSRPAGFHSTVREVSSRRTKIVATLGPATSTRDRIAELIEAGMDVARMNFSHGSYEEHSERIAAVRDAAAAAGRSIAILQDLQGPKIRTGPLEGGGPVELRTGSTFTLTTESVPGCAERVSTTYAALASDVEPGDRILLSDGAISLRAVRTTDTEVVTEVVYGGTLEERQGINLPGVDISVRGVTDKDIEDLQFGLRCGVDYVAISFVRSADEVRQVGQLIAQAGSDAPVIAKLEKPEAIEALDEIIEAANRAAKPVITATQMLESMIVNPRPTRAEASDVANAILDGTDAVMLSGETAIGAHPVETIRTMVRIAQEIETGAPRQPERRRRVSKQALNSPEAIAAAVEAVVEALPQVDAVWVFTQSGTTARLIARHRPRVPVIGFTPSERCHRRMSLTWGVTPIQTQTVSSFRDLAALVFPLAEQRGLATPGDTVVVTGSHPFDEGAPTNFLKVHTVGT